jgi:hypothetical protein
MREMEMTMECTKQTATTAARKKAYKSHHPRSAHLFA